MDNVKWNLNWNWYIFIHENPIENVVWKIMAILSRSQCVKDKNSGNACTYALTCNPDRTTSTALHVLPGVIHVIIGQACSHTAGAFFSWWPTRYLALKVLRYLARSPQPIWIHFIGSKENTCKTINNTNTLNKIIFTLALSGLSGLCLPRTIIWWLQHIWCCHDKFRLLYMYRTYIWRQYTSSTGPVHIPRQFAVNLFSDILAPTVLG